MRAGVGLTVAPDSVKTTIGVSGHTGKAGHVVGAQDGKANGPAPESDPEQAEMAQAALLKLLGSVRR